MAMRPTGDGAAGPKRPARTGGVRPVYEDFRPVSEWQEDDESHILNIFLPGFRKEQIIVSTEGRNTIRVRGERLVAGNKWSRFQEDFQVPENGEMNSIRAKHQGGILIISVPKKEVIKPRDAFPPAPKSTDIQKQPIPQKGKDKVIPEVGTSQPTDKKSYEPQKASRDHAQDAERKKSSELKEKHIASEKPDDMTKITVDKEWKLEDSKKLPDVEPAKKMKLKNDGVAGTPVKKAEDRESNGKQTMHSSGADYGAFKMGKYKKAMKGLTELNEERQLLVNMGAAVLVIMALSAYVTYKFVSGKDKN